MSFDVLLQNDLEASYWSVHGAAMSECPDFMKIPTFNQNESFLYYQVFGGYIILQISKFRRSFNKLSVIF
jgi:hypothetical protein